MFFQGRQVGRSTIPAGGTETILIWQDPEGSPPSQWTLVVNDPNGGSVVTVTGGHDEVSIENIASPATAAGQNVLLAVVFGSSITVRITAGTSTQFDAMLIRVNT